jgi:hypothetical protein
MLLFCAVDVFAGDIYGMIKIQKQNGQSTSYETPIKATMTVKCGSKNYTKNISIPGSYKLKVAEKGECSLNLKFGQKEADSEVHLRNSPVKYDFKVKEDSDGNWSLLRD